MGSEMCIRDSSPTVKKHVEYMLEKSRKKLWTIRHLKNAGLSSSDMLKVFNTVVRSTLEYAVPTYHPMLTGELSDEIESIQKRACKLIFGWSSQYDELISIGTIETLATRRERLMLNFAKKAASDARFKHWFPERDYSELNLRNQSKYVESFARTTE